MGRDYEGIYDRSYALVDLDIIRENVRNARKLLPKGCRFCAVLKADAYGHGAPAVASAIDDLSDFYAVATPEEGALLRAHGFQKPILVLGAVSDRAYPMLLERRIRPAIFLLSQAKALSKAAGEAGCTALLHLAVDTGMGRIGIDSEEEGSVELALSIAALPNLKVEGIFTHFSTADEADKEFSFLQRERFRRFCEKLSERGLSIPIRHCANSAGIIASIGTDFDMVRDGIALYGIYPSRAAESARLPLKAALSWFAKVSAVRRLPASSPISYGRTFTTARETELAVIPLGYGDGLPRLLSNRAEVLIRGRRCPILGRICMDQFMADVTGLGVRRGDRVTLLGRDGEEEIGLYDWERLGAFPYEVLCGLGKRVPRLYLRGGELAGRKDCFSEEYRDFSACF